ncbi:DNA cytosine methyltransferase [Saccharopolyspora sp. NPDC000359]|uniref:DNA cytosine methyltransferase n=1 Tax=Saccharopolyspora sp. NPDC000359 TaxID=3154251 RepID=UPI00332C2EF0
MLTLYDEFAGWGGSSQGFAAVPGVELVMAANHDELAVEVHGMNFPAADHFCGDVAKTDIARFPAADLFWASPSCPPWSNARGVRRDFDRTTQGLLFGEEVVDPNVTRARALMQEVPRYLEAMILRGRPVLAGVIENVVECRRWDQWRHFRRRIELAGYRTRLIALNSMHAAPRTTWWAPQSRDRLYLAYWWARLGRDPDWDKWLRPRAWCPDCGEFVDALQVFKQAGVDMGRYGRGGQYLYRCPRVSCRNRIVEPAAMPASWAIDWSLAPGCTIGEREEPLKPATLERIRAGLAKHARPLLAPAGGTWRQAAVSVGQPMPTRTTRETDGLVIPPLAVPLTSRAGRRAYSVGEPLRTQTCRQETALVLPPFMTTLRGGGSKRSSYGVDQPLATFSADGYHHGLVTPPGTEHLSREQLLMSYYSNGTTRRTSEPMGTLTTKDRYALISVDHHTPAVEDCTFRMLTPREIAAGMAFADDYKVKGSKRKQVRGFGNAVTPPVSELLGCALVEAVTGEDISRHTTKET